MKDFFFLEDEYSTFVCWGEWLNRAWLINNAEGRIHLGESEGWDSGLSSSITGENRVRDTSKVADKWAGPSMWVFMSHPLTAPVSFSEGNKGHQLCENGRRLSNKNGKYTLEEWKSITTNPSPLKVFTLTKGISDRHRWPYHRES